MDVEVTHYMMTAAQQHGPNIARTAHHHHHHHHQTQQQQQQLYYYYLLANRVIF